MKFGPLVVASLVMSIAALAQTGLGTITGIVSDQTDSAVANARIEAENTETGIAYQSISTETGNYSLTQLPVGKYRLTVNAQRFKKYDRRNLEVTAAGVLRIDVPLEIGSNADTITVIAEATLLKTENSELAHDVRVSQMQNLPILAVGGNGTAATSGVRNPWALVLLIPGTQFVSNSSLSVNGSGTSYSMRVEGMDATINDGNIISTQRVQPSVDAIQEVSVQTSNYPAEFGTVGGGIFNTTMRSGSNQYHGSLYDYAVNEVLNAAQPYTGSKTKPRRHDYGGTLGGPVKIPKLYNGQNKTFFFWNFEQFRENALITAAPPGGFPTVPVDAYRSGDFSQVIVALGSSGIPRPLQTSPGVSYVDPLGRQYNSGQIFDRLSWQQVLCNKTAVPTATCTNGTLYQVADPFGNNAIPQTKTYMDPVAQKILALVPEPKGVAAGQLGNNYQNPWVTHRTTQIPSAKIDQTIGPSGRLSFYWGNTTTESQYSAPGGSMEGFPAPITAARGTFIYSRTIRLNYDHTLTPTLLLHLGAGYFNVNSDDRAPTTDFNALTQLGLSGATLNRNFPNFTTSTSSTTGGMSTLGTAGGNQSQSYEQKPQGNASLSWVRKSHSLKLGGEWRATGYPAHNLASTAGSYVFGAGPTSQPALQNVILSQGGMTGFPFADFLEGYVVAASVSVPTAVKTGQQQTALFLEDTWKVTRKLTVDLGLRWDYGLRSREEYGRFGNFSPSVADPSAGGHPGATIYEATCGCQFAANYPFAIGPRLGLAYQIDRKTVLRGGFGIVYTPISSVSGTATASANAGTPGFDDYLFKLQSGMPANVKPVWPAFDPANAVIPGQISNATQYLDPNAGRPSRQAQFSFGVQREISSNLVVEAAYVGSRNVWVTANGLNSPNALSQPYLNSLGFNDFTSATEAALLTTSIGNLNLTQKSTLARRGIGLNPYVGFPNVGLTSQTVAQSILPFPQFSPLFAPLNAPLGKTWYDALQVTMTKRLSRGLSLNANYTFSKALSLISSPDIFNPILGKNLSTTDLPHQFRLSAEYTVPRIRSGNSILSNKALTYILGDWGIGWYMSYQSAPLLGRPNTTTITGINQFLGRGPGTAQYVTGQSLWSTHWTDYAGVVHTDPIDINCHCFDPTKTLVLNPAAWSNIPDGQWGAQQSASFLRTEFRGFRYPQENANISRNFRLRERMSLQVRVEFTNVFNRTQLPQPNVASLIATAPPNTFTSGPFAGLYSSGFGTITPTTGTQNSRSGLLIARLTF